MKKSTLFGSMVMITCLVFSVSCVSKAVEVTETYYETEYKTEEYRTAEQYEFKTPHPTPLFYRTKTAYGPFILFNMGGEGYLYWAELERGNQFPL